MKAQHEVSMKPAIPSAAAAVKAVTEAGPTGPTPGHRLLANWVEQLPDVGVDLVGEAREIDTLAADLYRRKVQFLEQVVHLWPTEQILEAQALVDGRSAAVVASEAAAKV